MYYQFYIAGPNSPYPWEYWPHDDGRSECGFVGLTNLGATCYMASCMQHLFMMPEARYSILSTKTDENTKHKDILIEIQKMFAYLLVRYVIISLITIFFEILIASGYH